ncbi:AraC family transcriptional regulator [Nocardiopsis valliformis]|uniref:AraC family transcriptional regulator n=1 Tax=Nocardiopsis valliformis TaxID=239974 RepID=UPI0003493549|nr:AraC family transcriptional regulator [Nocardiopsis valliformis]
MDALADFLDGVRARGSPFSQTLLSPPWLLLFSHSTALTVVTMVRGSGWLLPEGGGPLRLNTGDIAIVQAPGPHTVAGHPDTVPQYVISAADVCTTPDGTPVRAELALGLRVCGVSPDGPDLLLSGSYDVAGEISRRLLSVLPCAFVVPATEYRCAAMDLVVEETLKERSGQQVVLDRLLDLVLICALRHWFDRPETRAPSWYPAMADPVVGSALRLMHERPAQPWTVASLAERCGVSRAALARRFHTLVGEPPMAYLTEWRITRAVEHLREGETTVETIAHRVGYSSAFALSVAFKRLRGTTPTDYRRALVQP